MSPEINVTDATAAAHVYRVFDVDEHLLYVGFTTNVTDRMAQHAHRTPWWNDAHRVAAAPYMSEDAARRAETEAIAHERPRHNVVGKRKVDNGLGAMFHTLRTQAGIPQAALAAAIGVSKSHLSHFENGRRDISRATYDRLIHALAVEGTRQRRGAA